MKKCFDQCYRNGLGGKEKSGGVTVRTDEATGKKCLFQINVCGSKEKNEMEKRGYIFSTDQ